MDLQILYFVVLGLLGGFVAVLLPAKGFSDLTTFASVKRYVVGGIVGGLYFMLYSQHNFPNFIMAFISGYSGTDFINKLLDRMKKEEGEKK